MFGDLASGVSELKLVKASCFAGDVLENRWGFFYSFVRSRERLVFGYFLKIPFFTTKKIL